MLSRIQASELKAMIDKFTEIAETVDKLVEPDEYFVVQRSDSLFWGGFAVPWTPLVRNSVRFPTAGKAYEFHNDYFKGKNSKLGLYRGRLKVLAISEASNLEHTTF